MLIDHLNYMLQESNLQDKFTQFKLENTFQLLRLCLSSKKFVSKASKMKEEFIHKIQKFLEKSYMVKSSYSPPLMAKSLLCTVIVILELFPGDIMLIDEFVPLQTIGKLLKMTPSLVDSAFDERDFLSDVIDILCYIAKDEFHVLRIASDNEIYKLIKIALDSVSGKRHVLLHSIINLATTLTGDRSARNHELANDKWGVDYEGFKLLEQLREKTSADVTIN